MRQASRWRANARHRIFDTFLTPSYGIASAHGWAGLKYLIAISLLLSGVIGARAVEAISLALPIKCQVGLTCFVQNYVDHDASDAVRDYSCGRRSYDAHDGTDELSAIIDQESGPGRIIVCAAGNEGDENIHAMA